MLTFSYLFFVKKEIYTILLVNYTLTSKIFKNILFQNNILHARGYKRKEQNKNIQREREKTGGHFLK